MANFFRQYPRRPTQSGTVPHFVEQCPKNVEQLPKKWNRSRKRISVPQIVTQNKTIIWNNNLNDYLLRCDTQSKWYSFCGIVLLFAELWTAFSTCSSFWGVVPHFWDAVPQIVELFHFAAVFLDTVLFSTLNRWKSIEFSSSVVGQLLSFGIYHMKCCNFHWEPHISIPMFTLKEIPKQSNQNTMTACLMVWSGSKSKKYSFFVQSGVH